MASPSRATQFAKLHKVLKKHYKPVSVSAERPVLEHLVFACLLEDAHYDVAEETFAKVTEEYFGWNEVRVSTIRELSETMARLPDPPAAATRVKRVLQHVFETSYSFDLETLRKKNLGPASETLQKVDGTTPFAVSYVVQSALGGHSIPLDTGTLEVMRILDLATEKELETRSIAGLERAIAKNKGVEFGSLLHQLGADFTANPFATELREKLLEIDPEAKKRWPKRRSSKKTAETPAPVAEPGNEKTPAKKTDAPAAADGTPREGKTKRKADSSPKAASKQTIKKAAPTKRKGESSAGKSPGASGSKKKDASRLSKRKPR